MLHVAAHLAKKPHLAFLHQQSVAVFAFLLFDVIVATLQCMHLLFLCLSCLFHDC